MTVTTSTQKPLPGVSLCIEVFLKYFCGSDSYLKTSQATRNRLKIQVLLCVISVLRKAISLIPLQAGPVLWSQLLAVLRGLWKVSRRAYTICNSYVSATYQAAPAGFQRCVVALLWLLPSVKCWRALKHDTTIVLSETWSIVFACAQNRLGHAHGEKRYSSTRWDNTACANNCERLEAYVRNAWHN